MSEDVFDEQVSHSFQRMAEACDAGISPELARRLGHISLKSEVTICEIVTLPALHQRKSGTMYPTSTGATALVLEFPAPRWQRNASERS